MGHAFEIEDGAASGQRICYGDTAIDDSLLTLSYGGVWQHGNFNCKSDQNGLICANGFGHGFSLSRDFQRLF
jgi:hypothetical protein